MRPAQRAEHRGGLVAGMVEVVVTAIGVGLQDTGPARQVPGRVFFPAVCREVIERGRWCPTAEGPVIAQIGPEPGRLRAAFGQKRHGRVVGMQSLGAEDMGADQRLDRLQGDGAGPDLIGERRKADLDAFLGVALGLPVQRLVLAELLEENHGQQVGTGPSPRRRMERRWRLADLLASPAGELLPHRLDHLPLARDDLQRIGDILTHLYDAVRATARTAGRCLDHHTLARQMFGEGFAHGLAPREGAHSAGLVRRPSLFNRHCILGRRCFQFLKLQFQLIDQTCAALGGDAVPVTAQLGDFQLQLLDHRICAGCQGARLGQVALSRLRTGCLCGQFSAQCGDFGCGI